VPAVLSGQGFGAGLGRLASRATGSAKDKDGKKRERDVSDGPFGQDEEKRSKTWLQARGGREERERWK